MQPVAVFYPSKVRWKSVLRVTPADRGYRTARVSARAPRVLSRTEHRNPRESDFLLRRALRNNNVFGREYGESRGEIRGIGRRPISSASLRRSRFPFRNCTAVFPVTSSRFYLRMLGSSLVTPRYLLGTEA
jgi:hypothetical protein